MDELLNPVALALAKKVAVDAARILPYTQNPAMNGTASPGSSGSFARGDHVHPVDTSRQDAQSIANDYCPPLYRYEGKDLTVAFADEIAASPYNGDEWAWIKGRLTAQNIAGLFVKDYIPLTVKDNSNQDVTLIMQIADINHDLGNGETEITAWHMDFISKNLWPERHPWNKAAYNNGIADEQNPWCASDLKAWLNSEVRNSGTTVKGVPNEAAADPELAEVDYSTTGVYDKLPSALRDVIIEYRSHVEKRYKSGELKQNDNGEGYSTLGKLWILNDIEVSGQIVTGSRSSYSTGLSRQFPIFADGKAYVKKAGNSRVSWWLRTASTSSTSLSVISSEGYFQSISANNQWDYVPICFRVSA